MPPSSNGAPVLQILGNPTSTRRNHPLNFVSSQYFPACESRSAGAHLGRTENRNAAQVIVVNQAFVPSVFSQMEMSSATRSIKGCRVSGSSRHFQLQAAGQGEVGSAYPRVIEDKLDDGLRKPSSPRPSYRSPRGCAWARRFLCARRCRLSPCCIRSNCNQRRQCGAAVAGNVRDLERWIQMSRSMRRGSSSP